MSESRERSAPVPASGTVHWIGAGLSTGSGLAALCDTADCVRLWHRTEERAARCLAGLGLTGRVVPRAFTLPALAAEPAPGDVVVSMLPAPDPAAGTAFRPPGGYGPSSAARCVSTAGCAPGTGSSRS